MFQQDVMGTIGSVWFAPEAQRFCKEYIEETAANIMRIAHNAYSSTNMVINDAAQKWAIKTGATFNTISLVQDSNNLNKVDSSVIMNNKNGFVGIQNIDGIKMAGRNLSRLLKQVDEISTETKLEISKAKAFFGDGQIENLSGWWKTLEEEIKTAITEGIHLVDLVNEKVEKYQSTAQANARRFASGN